VVQVSRRALERLERVWWTPVPEDAPQVVTVPLPPTFGPQTIPAPAQQGVESASESLASAFQSAAAMRMFAFRRERDIKSLGFEGQATGLTIPAGG
jgi:hypothetical protein